MAAGILGWSLFLAACGLLSASGERVEVDTQAPRTQPCTAPTHLRTTIRRGRGSEDNQRGQTDAGVEAKDIELILNRNQELFRPRHVVQMSSSGLDMQLEEVEVSQSSWAFHSTERLAAIVVTCKQQADTPTDYFLLDGTFFHDGTKFRLSPINDDVEHTLIDDVIRSHYILEEIDEFNSPGDHGYIDAHAIEAPPTAQTPSDIPEESPLSKRLLHRMKRSTETYTIDILPVIDYILYKNWLVASNNDEGKAKEDLTTYMVNVFTSMSVRVKTLTIQDVELKLAMIEPHIFLTAESSAYSEDIKEVSNTGGATKINVEVLLDAFKSWVGNKTASLPDHDHAMLFTAYDVYGGQDGEVGSDLTRGLAFLSTICRTDGYSSSVVQDKRAYQSEPVAVHELGHSLGSKHDGQENACSSLDRYIMANQSYEETDATRLNPFAFSSCSSTVIEDKIQELAATSSLEECLIPKTGQDLSTIVPLSPTDQCQTLFGPTSYVCRGENFPPIDGVCVAMYCSIPGISFCRKLVAATGTCCGNGKYCKEGRCIQAGSGQCVLDEVCPFDDQPGELSNGEKCEEIAASLCYQQVAKDQCCHSCQDRLKTQKAAGMSYPSCEYGDKVEDGCDVSQCGDNTNNGAKYSSICCHTCAGNDDNKGCEDVPGILFQGKTWTCDALLRTYGGHFCYFPVVHTSACCELCNAYFTGEKDCAYGDALHKIRCDQIPALNRVCTTEEAEQCCQTCPGIVVNTTDSGTGGDEDGNDDSNDNTTDNTDNTTDNTDNTDNGGDGGDGNDDGLGGDGNAGYSSTIFTGSHGMVNRLLPVCISGLSVVFVQWSLRHGE